MFVAKQAAETAQLLQPFTDKKTGSKIYFNLLKSIVNIGNNFVSMYFALSQLLVGALFMEA